MANIQIKRILKPLPSCKYVNPLHSYYLKGLCIFVYLNADFLTKFFVLDSFQHILLIIKYVPVVAAY